MNPEQYCQTKAAQSGSSFYYSFRFLPEQQRRAITALYAFCREIDDVVDECRDVQVARIKLNWWREEITRLFNNNPSHPICKALLPHAGTFNLDQTHFNAVIDGMGMDLEQSVYADFEALSLYCYRVASVIGLMSAAIFGYQQPDTLKYAHDLGIAFQLTNIIRDVREDAQRGRIYLPQDEMMQFGVQNDDILQYRMSDEFRQLMQAQTKRAKSYYDSAFQHLPDIDRYSQRSGIIMAKIYQTTLTEIELDNFQVFQHRIRLTPLRKLWIAWRTARQEKLIYKKTLKAQAA